MASVLSCEYYMTRSPDTCEVYEVRGHVVFPLCALRVRTGVRGLPGPRRDATRALSSYAARRAYTTPTVQLCTRL